MASTLSHIPRPTRHTPPRHLLHSCPVPFLSFLLFLLSLRTQKAKLMHHEIMTSPPHSRLSATLPKPALLSRPSPWSAFLFRVGWFRLCFYHSPFPLNIFPIARDFPSPRPSLFSNSPPSS